MKFKILQNNISCFLVILLIFTFVKNLEAATPSYQPAPLRNQSLLFESNGKAIRKIKLDVSSIKKPVVKKITNSKTPYRNLFWKVEGKSYDIPIRVNSKSKVSYGSLHQRIVSN